MTQKWTENSLLMRIKLNFRKVKKKIKCQTTNASCRGVGGRSGGGAGEWWKGWGVSAERQEYQCCFCYINVCLFGRGQRSDGGKARETWVRDGGEIPVEERGEDGWLDRTARRGGGGDRGIQNGDEEEFEVYRVTGSGSRQRPLSHMEQLCSSSGPRVVFVCLRLYLR